MSGEFHAVDVPQSQACLHGAKRAPTTQAAPIQREIIEIEDDEDELDFDEIFPKVNSQEEEGWQEAFTYLTPDMTLSYGPSTVINGNKSATEQGCLTGILDVFPDICHAYVRDLYAAHMQASTSDPTVPIVIEVVQALTVKILDKVKYPKEKTQVATLKRKRQSSQEGSESKWMAPSRPLPCFEYTEAARRVLQDEFPRISVKSITMHLAIHKYIYPTYFAIENEQLGPKTALETLKTPRKSKPSRGNPTDDEWRTAIAIETDLELNDAKKKRSEDVAKRLQEQQHTDREAAFDLECQQRGEIMDCACCFTETSIPRMIFCNGNEPHFFCQDCAKSYVKSQLELSKYEILCMDGSGCKANFTGDQKRRFLDIKTLDLLERLQQQDDLRNAGLENLEHCPFCDYAAICPPVEEDREFRCKMPDCERTSCRLCRMDTHVPLSCAEYKQEHGISERHVLEEAMTDAILKHCPKCKVPIFKDGGCNKLSCSRCGCKVCDVCKKDITKDGYSHFDMRGGCAAQDDTETRNRQAIESAEKNAMADVRAENPGLSEGDLKIKFSESVLESTNRPKRYEHDAYVQAMLNHGIPVPLHPRQFERGPRFGEQLAAGIHQMVNQPGVGAHVPGRNPAEHLAALDRRIERLHANLEERRQAGLREHQQALARNEDLLGVLDRAHQRQRDTTLHGAMPRTVDPRACMERVHEEASAAGKTQAKEYRRIDGRNNFNAPALRPNPQGFAVADSVEENVAARQIRAGMDAAFTVFDDRRAQERRNLEDIHKRHIDELHAVGLQTQARQNTNHTAGIAISPAFGASLPRNIGPTEPNVKHTASPHATAAIRFGTTAGKDSGFGEANGRPGFNLLGHRPARGPPPMPDLTTDMAAAMPRRIQLNQKSNDKVFNDILDTAWPAPTMRDLPRPPPFAAPDPRTSTLPHINPRSKPFQVIPPHPRPMIAQNKPALPPFPSYMSPTRAHRFEMGPPHAAINRTATPTMGSQLSSQPKMPKLAPGPTPKLSGLEATEMSRFL